MFSEEINKLSIASEKKYAFFKESGIKYLLALMLAGIYVGFGILLIFSIGGMLSAANSPITKIIIRNKITATSIESFIRGILCNMLVCLLVMDILIYI